MERTTVHISDDTGRIAMLEKRTIGTAANDHNTKASLTRFIYSNHLQSASLELDEDAAVISYEEYHPYGTTAYQANNSDINAVAKRYRYTGKERDEESGLYYHGARYYIPWLCRWTACDPMQSEMPNWSSYCYGFCNPITYNDPSGMVPGDGNEPMVVEALGFSTFSSVPTNDNASVYQRPRGDDPPSMGPVTGPLAGYMNSLSLDQRLEMYYYASHYEPDVLMADIYGAGHMGPQSDVQSIVNSIQQEYANAVFENIRGGPFGALGYWTGGEEGTFRGAILDQLSLGAHFSPTRSSVKSEKAETNFASRVEQFPVNKFQFEREGYTYTPKTTISKEGISVTHEMQMRMTNNQPLLVGFSTISSEGSLTNVFEVPSNLQKKGVSKAMYHYLGSLGYKSIDGSYSPSSDNYKAFMSVYDAAKMNNYEAVMATPAAKAIGDGFYPSYINVQSKQNQVTKISVIWSKK